jgi:hypothetical protein
MTAPRRRSLSAATPPSKVVPKVVYWFECSSADLGESWQCVYIGSQEYGLDYWDDRGDLMTTSDCTYNHSQYCDQTLRSGPYNEPYGTDASNLTQRDSPDASDTPPNCTSPKNVYEQSYCKGTRPGDTQLALLNQAFDAIEQRGDVCLALAAIGRQVVANGTLRIFNQSDFHGFSGSAPTNGASVHPELNEWMTLSADWFTRWPDAAHATKPSEDRYAPRTLQRTLVHELDHLMGYAHSAQENNPEWTPNENQCSDVQH